MEDHSSPAEEAMHQSRALLAIEKFEKKYGKGDWEFDSARESVDIDWSNGKSLGWEVIAKNTKGERLAWNWDEAGKSYSVVKIIRSSAKIRILAPRRSSPEPTKTPTQEIRYIAFAVAVAVAAVLFVVSIVNKNQKHTPIMGPQPPQKNPANPEQQKNDDFRNWHRLMD